MNEYLVGRLGELRIEELRREAELVRLAASARSERGEARQRLKATGWFAWRARWRASAAVS